MVGKTYPLKVVLSAVDRVTAPARRAAASITNIGLKGRAAGQALSVGLTVPLALLGGQAARTGLEFAKTENRLQALTNAGSEGMARMTDRALVLGETTSKTATEAAEGMTFLGQAGFRTEQILETIEPTLRLSEAAMADLGESADIVSDILKSSGTPVEQTGRLVDILAAAVTNSTTDLTQFAEGMKFAVPAAREMGLELEQTATLMAALSDAGLKGTIGGVAIRNMMVQLAKPTAAAAATLQKLGIAYEDVFDAQGRLDVFEMLRRLQSSGAGLGDLARIFTGRTGVAVAPLVRQAGEPLLDLFERISETGVAARMAEQQMKGLPGQVARLEAAFVSAQLRVMRGGLGEVLGEMADKAREWLATVGQASPETIKFWSRVALGVGVLGPLAVVLGSVLTAVGTLTKALALLGGVGLLTPIGQLVTLGLVAAFLARNWEAAAVAIEVSVERIGSAWENLKRRAGAGILERLFASIGAASGNARLGRLIGQQVGGGLRGAEREADIRGATQRAIAGRLLLQFQNAPSAMRIVDASMEDLGLDVTLGPNLGTP